MKRKIIALLLLAIMVAAISFWWSSKSQEVMMNAQGIIKTTISNALGSAVDIGKIEITSYNTITIHDITIYDKQSRALAASEKVTLTYSPLSILRGQAVVAAISDVAVQNPTLWLLQTSSGYWNVQDIIKADDDKEFSSFRGNVTLHHGTAIVNALGEVWSMEDINGNVDCANNPSMQLALQGIHNEGTIYAKGIVNSKGRSTITILANQLPIADYQNLLPAESLGLRGGNVKDITVTLAKEQENIEWAGEASLDKVELNIDGMSVSEVQGNIAFTNKKVYIYANGKLLEQPLDVRGNIRIDTSEPIVNLVMKSAEFNPNVVTSDFPFNGKLAFKADVTGSIKNPIVSGDVSWAAAEVAGYQTYNVQANVQMANQKLMIHSGSGDIFGGHVNAAGIIELATGMYQLHATAQQIDLAMLENFLPGWQGRGDADITAKGVGDVSNADLTGTVAIGQGEITGVAFDSLAAGFYRHGDIIAVDYINLGIAQGMVSASGVVDHQTLNLTAYGHGLALAQLDKQGTGMHSGQGNFAGQITGTLLEPEVVASFSASGGRVFYQPFAEVKGVVHANRQQIVLEDVNLQDGVTQHHVHGTIGLDEQQPINLTVLSEQARAENLVKLLSPGEKLTGNVNNRIVLTGTLTNPDVEGHLLLTDGSFRGQLVAKGEAFYKREQGVTTIAQCSIYSLNTQIRLSGSITVDNELNFDIAAQDIDLERLAANQSYTAAGRAYLDGKLTGNLNNPLFQGRVLADKLRINNQEFSSITSSVAYNGTDIEIQNLSFMQGTGKFNFVGGFTLNTNEVYGNLDMENAEISYILAMAEVPDKGIRGLLNGHIKVNGKAKKPNIWLTGNIKTGSIKKQALDSVNIDASLENNVVTINDLSAMQGNGVLVARGTADLDGSIDLEVGGRDIDAGLVAAFFTTDIEPTGKIGFTAQISGVASNPHTAVSLEIANGGIGSTTFDSLFGLLILDNKEVRINQALMKKGPYQASAYGTIPVAAFSSAGRATANRTEQMDLKVRLDEANLSILPLLTKQVAWAEGKTQGEINVTGTLDNPSMAGNIIVNNGTMKFKVLNEPIQKMDLDISFEGDTINIKKFDGHMGKGMYSLTGTAKLHGMSAPDYDLSLVLNKPEISSKYFTGPIDGNLNFNNKDKQPKLSGKLLFEKDTINIPIIPEAQMMDMNIAFDVQMVVGKKVRFYNPYLYDIAAEGKMNFAGTMNKPDFSGHLRAVRGSVNYLRTRFSILEGSLQFRKFASLEPIVKLSAQATLQQVIVNLNINGPMSALQFNLTSDPVMRQQEILSLLTLRSRYTDKQHSGNSGGVGRDEVVSVIGAGLQIQVVSEVENAFRGALGLDEFRLVQDSTSNVMKKSYTARIQSAAASQESYNIEMSKYLTDKLLLSYTMGVNQANSDLTLRYALTRRTNVNASIDQQSRWWLGVETRFRF